MSISLIRINNIALKFISFALVALMLMFTGTASADDDSAGNGSDAEIETDYHLYYGDNRVGIVDDPDLVEKTKKEMLEVYENEENINLTFEHDVTLIPETVFQTRAANRATLESFKETAVVKAEAWKLSAGSDKELYITASADPEEFERELILNFTDEDELTSYENAINEETEHELESSVITNIYFSEELEWEEVITEPEKVLTEVEAEEKLINGTLEKDLYEIREGDILGSVAADHNLTLKELKNINPGISEDSILKIGDELNVTILKPIIYVIIEKSGTKEVTIPYETVTNKNKDMWKGETEVLQEGVDGKKIVEKKLILENGQLLSETIISEEIISEAKEKIVAEGTKTSSSRGTGVLAWPAVGGYISSEFGMRWGRMHRGLDIARPSNYNILAADNGKVTSAGWENGYGNTVRINHNNGIETVYAHLARIDVSRGHTVAKGQNIGKMGSTGNSTGIHLHFEVYENGSAKNPRNYLNR